MTDKYYFDEKDYLVEVSDETLKAEAKIKGRTKAEMGTAYWMVKEILKHNEDSRNSDKLLIQEVTKKCKEQSVRVPAHETITRCRRKIQNNEGLYPASVEIQERRKIREQEFRDSMGE